MSAPLIGVVGVVRIQCPSVSLGMSELTHEPCVGCSCAWWTEVGRCGAADTIPVGRLTRRLACGLWSICRWARQANGGACPPMRLGEICEHQGGTFNVNFLA